MNTCSLTCVVLSQLMQDKLGETALISAIGHSDHGTASLLLDLGANVNQKNKVRLMFVAMYVHRESRAGRAAPAAPAVA